MENRRDYKLVVYFSVLLLQTMKKILSNSIVVSIFLFLSKILGFIRDLLLASFFGSSSALQAFLIAFRLPEFMRKVTTSGMLTQVLNPHLESNISDEILAI